MIALPPMVLLKRISIFVGVCLLLRSIDSALDIIITLVIITISLAELFLRKREPIYEFLREEEVSENLNRFEPEPLVPETEIELPKKKIVGSRAGKRIIVDGKDCLNLATCQYFNFLEDEDIIGPTSDSISRNGVGSCGPRQFFGTIDVHLELENKLAEFFKTEEACIYSYGFCTAASVIPVFCKQTDIIFADEAVNFSIQKGLDATRSQVVYFKHNDTTDLERQVIENPAAPNQRRFLVAEGIYQTRGDLCPLPELVRIRKRYKLRMFLDESVSFGTVGPTGRGMLEQFDIPVKEVDVRIGSLEGAFASSGGFCCGSKFMMDSQRVYGAGYYFSASLPPLLAVTAYCALEKLKNSPHIVQNLQKISEALHGALEDLPGMTLVGDVASPLKHLQIAEGEGYENDMLKLEALRDACFDRGLAVVVPTRLPLVDRSTEPASIRVAANVNLTQDDLIFIRDTLRDACTKII